MASAATFVSLILSALQISAAGAAQSGYISYGALRRNSVPCSSRQYYYNCRPSPNYSNSHRIHLGSSLSPSSTTNSTWLSSSGRFAFGFYPQGNGFGIGIWFAQIPQHTVVWTPDRDDLPFSVNATLRLTTTGKFILQRTQQDPEEDFLYVDGQKKEPISWASMLDTGNFVLFDSVPNVSWQSFDFPANTLLPGQRLLPGNELTSSVSDTDYHSINGSSRFRLLMQSDGNLVEYYATRKGSIRYSYWESGTSSYNIGDYLTLQLDGDGNLYLFDGNGNTVMTLSSTTTSTNNKTVFYRMTMDVDGILRLYSIVVDDNERSNWLINWESLTDKCDPIGICGMNAYCTYSPMEDKQAVCKCIPGFDFSDKSLQSSDCQSDEDCGNQKTHNSNFFMSPSLEKVKWKEDQYSVLSTPSEGKCKEACLADSNCEVALFEDQSCRLQKLPLRYGRRTVNTSTLTFVRGSNCSNSITLDAPFSPHTACFHVRLIHI